MSTFSELLLAQIWNAQWLRQDLRTSAGDPVRVVYRGVWSHGLGPDFTGAFLDIAGSLQQGAVEVHHRSSGWIDHGHDRDPAYDAVVLHVVFDDNLPEPVRRRDGRPVPTLALRDALLGPLEAFPQVASLRPLGAIGFAHCAPAVAANRPDAIRQVWEQAGDRRIADKASAVSGQLALEPPGQVLYALLLDALGIPRNREPMAAIASRLPWDHLEPRVLGRSNWHRAASLLLGVGGFLPLAPREAEHGGLNAADLSAIEEHWCSLAAPWQDICLSPSVWSLARLRPNAYPVRRLLAMAWLLAHLQVGLVEDVIAHLRQPNAYRALLRWLTADNPYLGAAHAHEVIVNVVVPFAFAYGEQASQDDLVLAAAALWDAMPAGRGNAETRRIADQICGPHRVPVRSARAEQGLLHLQRVGCAQMRCYECPIAHLALEADAPVNEG